MPLLIGMKEFAVKCNVIGFSSHLLTCLGCGGEEGGSLVKNGIAKVVQHVAYFIFVQKTTSRRVWTPVLSFRYRNYTSIYYTYIFYFFFLLVLQTENSVLNSECGEPGYS